MTKLFGVVLSRNHKEDLQKVLDFESEDFSGSLRVKKNSITEEEIEYEEKVRSYTHVTIGAKIGENAHHYTQQEINAGIINIDTAAVARVLDKWVEELKGKFDSAEK